MRKRLLFVILAPILLLVGLTALTIGILRAANINDVTFVQSIIGNSPLAQALVDYFPLVRLPLQLVFVVIMFLIAFAVSRSADRLAGWFLRLGNYDPDAVFGLPPEQQPADVAPAIDQAADAGPTLRERRQQTVRQLVAGFISFTAYILALVLSLGQFFSLANLAIVATVAANAFGFAARDYVGDLLNGVSNIFENRFNVGDKVAIFRVGDKIEGVVEQVTVRTIGIRTRGGELVNVPQGEVRILLNYSRGSYSGVDVIVKVAAADLPAAMAELLVLAEEAPSILPDSIATWTLVSRDGTLGSAAEIRIHARAPFGYGAGLRLKIMVLVEERFRNAGITLV